MKLTNLEIFNCHCRSIFETSLTSCCVYIQDIIPAGVELDDVEGVVSVELDVESITSMEVEETTQQAPSPPPSSSQEENPAAATESVQQ